MNRLVSWQGGWASVAKSNLPIVPINWLIYSNQLYLEEEFIHRSCSAPIEQHSQRAFKSPHRSGRICGLQKLVFMSSEVGLLRCVCQTRLSRLTWIHFSVLLFLWTQTCFFIIIIIIFLMWFDSSKKSWQGVQLLKEKHRKTTFVTKKSKAQGTDQLKKCELCNSFYESFLILQVWN